MQGATIHIRLFGLVYDNPKQGDISCGIDVRIHIVPAIRALERLAVSYTKVMAMAARTREQIDAITYLYCKIESITDAEERIFYMDKYFRELEKIKGYSDDNLRTSVVSKLTAKELKQLFHSRNCIGKLNLIENNKNERKKR